MAKQKRDLCFYTREQVAKILQVNPMTVYRYINDGKLKAYNIGSDLRISEADFNQFLQKALVQAKPKKSPKKATKPRPAAKTAKQTASKKTVVRKKYSKRSK